MREKFENFCNALQRLAEALQAEPTALNMDASIKRFEFTYELSWKVLKAFLARDGIECNSPRNCFNNAFQVDYVKNEDLWLNMIKDRNLTTHIYDEAEAKKIYSRIKGQYLKALEDLKIELSKKL